MSVTKQLEDQVNDLVGLYDLAEKAYPYQNLSGSIYHRDTNEHVNRQRNVHHQTYGPTSAYTLVGSSLWGLGFMLLRSRRGAAHILDFSTLRQCYYRSASWFLIGSSAAAFVKVNNTANSLGKSRL